MICGTLGPGNNKINFKQVNRLCIRTSRIILEMENEDKNMVLLLKK